MKYTKAYQIEDILDWYVREETLRQSIVCDVIYAARAENGWKPSPSQLEDEGKWTFSVEGEDLVVEVEWAEEK